MVEVKKLIEYTELSGFSIIPNGNKLTVKNGSNLPYQLKRLLTIYKEDVLQELTNKKDSFLIDITSEN